MSDNIPVGYVFASTDQQLLVDYLPNKVEGKPLPCNKAVTECDLYGTREPWEMFKDSMVYVDLCFFTKLKKKSANDLRVLRTVGKKGSWKAQRKADVLDKDRRIIGSKKGFVYEAKGSKNNRRYIMHEYQLPDVSQQSNEANGSRLNDYVLCRIKIIKGTEAHNPCPSAANLQQQEGNGMTTDAFGQSSGSKASLDDEWITEMVQELTSSF